MSLEDKMVNKYVKENSKDKRLTFILLVFLGILGVHRYYYGKFWSGMILGFLTISASVLKPLIILAIIWVILDFFIIRYKWFEEEKDKLERNALKKYKISIDNIK